MISQSRFKSEFGFTLIELLLVLSLVSIVSVVSISMVGSSIDEARFNDTLSRMQQLKTAIIGNTDQREGNVRNSFGYLGDLGAIPSAANGLGALTTKPSTFPNWAVNSVVRFGLGWNGPYVSSSFNSNPLLDGWGNAFVYNPTSNPPNITSLGSDGANGGTGYKQDIVLTIPNELKAATVYGFISSGGGPYSSTATVELYYPNGSGAVQTATANLNAGDKGLFQFSNIPLGKRSLTVFTPNKTSPTKTLGPILISVDQGNYLVPNNLVDVNPAGGGSGSGNSSLCASPSGFATYVAGTRAVGTTTIQATLKFTSTATITAVSVQTNSKSLMDRFNVNGTSYRCGSGRRISPCPAVDNQNSTINPTFNIGTVTGSKNIPIISRFTTNIATEKKYIVTLTYSTGCDVIDVNDL